VSLARDLKAGFARRPRSLPPKYFYDALGSRLFEAIGLLPWYRITRAETRLLRRAAPAVARALAGPVRVVELGSGSGEKLALVVEAIRARPKTADVHVVDLSAAALAASLQRLATIPGVRARGHLATYEKGLAEAMRPPRKAGECLVLFLGSNIGNFDPHEAQRLLVDVRRRLRPGDALLLGTDLVKEARALLEAYDDPLGLTAVFNLNVLLRLNRELGADFDLAAWEHRAAWNAEARRVEMHLVSLVSQRVAIPRAGVVADFAAGETIFTESSYKYESRDVRGLAAVAGFRRELQWIDDDARFALTLCRAVPLADARRKEPKSRARGNG
jgi:dimethylhistidine N-methyltransferase